MGAGNFSSKALSDALLRLYEISPTDNFYEQVLEMLEDYVPHVVSGYSFTDLRSRVLCKKALRNRQGESFANLSELEVLVQDHPFVDVYTANGAGPVVCISDLMSEKEWRQTAICSELERLLGVVYDWSLRFYSGRKCVSFFFSNDVPLEQSYRRFFTLLAPHLENAHRAFHGRQKGLIANLPENIVLLSSAGHLVECGLPASELFAKYFPREKGGFAGRLPDTAGRWVAGAIAGEHSLKALVVKKKDEVLSLSLLRLPDGYLLVLEESARVDLGEVLKDWGLTAREAEVLVWVAQGKQNSEVGVILNISTSTVRKHVENILKKLRCETRGAASQVVMQALLEKSMGVSSAKCLLCSRPDCASLS